MCGEYILQDHKYVDYIKASESVHTAICECGYEAENIQHCEHRYVHTIMDGDYHRVYCICGHLIGTEEHQLRFLMGRTYCILCNYELIDSGLDIMSKTEEQDIF